MDTFFILGLPHETEATINQTIKFAIKLDPDYANFFITVPYPGTELYEMAKTGDGGLNTLTADWDMYGWQMGSAAELKQVSRKRLEALQLKAYMRFYLRLTKLKNMLNMVNIKVLPTYLNNIVRKKLGIRQAGIVP